MKTLLLIGAALAFGAAAIAQAQDVTPAVKNRSDPSAIKCRQIQVTGSLVRKERVCKTNAQWRAISEGQNREADDLITRSRAGLNSGN